MLTSVKLIKWDEISHLPDMRQRLLVHHELWVAPLELRFLYSEERHKDSIIVFYDRVNFMADVFPKIVSFSSKSSFLPGAFPFCHCWQHATCFTWGQEQCSETHDIDNANFKQPNREWGIPFNFIPFSVVLCSIECLHLCVSQFVC